MSNCARRHRVLVVVLTRRVPVIDGVDLGDPRLEGLGHVQPEHGPTSVTKGSSVRSNENWRLSTDRSRIKAAATSSPGGASHPYSYSIQTLRRPSSQIPPSFRWIL